MSNYADFKGHEKEVLDEFKKFRARLNTIIGAAEDRPGFHMLTTIVLLDEQNFRQGLMCLTTFGDKLPMFGDILSALNMNFLEKCIALAERGQETIQ